MPRRRPCCAIAPSAGNRTSYTPRGLSVRMRIALSGYRERSGAATTHGLPLSAVRLACRCGCLAGLVVRALRASLRGCGCCLAGDARSVPVSLRSGRRAPTAPGNGHGPKSVMRVPGGGRNGLGRSRNWRLAVGCCVVDRETSSGPPRDAGRCRTPARRSAGRQRRGTAAQRCRSRRIPCTGSRHRPVPPRYDGRTCSTRYRNASWQLGLAVRGQDSRASYAPGHVAHGRLTASPAVSTIRATRSSLWPSCPCTRLYPNCCA